MTIRARFNTIKPRADLARRLHISAPYACDIAAGEPIGSTKTLARISAELGLSDADIGASVREMFPEPFAARDVAGSDHAPDPAADATHDQPVADESGAAA